MEKTNTHPFEKIVLYEDNHLLVVNKPNNVLVQGDKTRDRTLLDEAKAYIKQKYQKPGNVFLGLVHRLDRPVSGVLIFARTSKALSRLNKQLREHQIHKVYWAITDRSIDPEAGLIESFLLKNTTKNVVATFNNRRPGSKQATTKYRHINSVKGRHLIELQPITGRSHQLRVHLSSRKAPILGDLKYGARYALHDKSIALHCRQMSIIHPVTKTPTDFVARPVESDHWNLFRHLFTT